MGLIYIADEAKVSEQINEGKKKVILSVKGEGGSFEIDDLMRNAAPGVGYAHRTYHLNEKGLRKLGIRIEG